MADASGYLGLPADREMRNMVLGAAESSRIAVSEFTDFVQATADEGELDLEEINRRLVRAQPVNSTRWPDREEIWAELAGLYITGLNGPRTEVIKETLVKECLSQLVEKLGEARRRSLSISDATPSALRHRKSSAKPAAVSARPGKETLTRLSRRWT